MNEDFVATEPVKKEEDFVQRHTVEFAVAGIKKEIRRELKDMPIEGLHLLVKMLQDKDWIILTNVSDFVAFLRSFGRLLPHEKQVELFDYTQDVAKDVLREKVTRELARSFSEAIQELTRKNIMEMPTARDVAEKSRRAEDLKKWMMENARNAFRKDEE